MPALASLEELREVDKGARAFREAYPEAFRELSAFLRRYRRVGYKNIVKLLLEESTPEKLKRETG
jgi:hypothetical protein